MGLGKFPDPSSKQTPRGEDFLLHANKKKNYNKVLHFYSMSPTKQPDDIRMVEVLHADRFIQELLNFPLGETIHCIKNHHNK